MAGRRPAAEATEWERRFVHAWLGNGRNATQAALACGAPEKSAKTRACLALKRPRVVSYIGTCVQEAIANMEAERSGAVASLQECLEGLTAHARARLGDYITEHGEVLFDAVKVAPAGLVKKFQRLVTVSAEGQVFERTNLELESGQAAYDKLKDYHVAALKRAEDEVPKDSLAMFADALRGLATLRHEQPGLMKALMRRWLSGDAIDVPPPVARRLPAGEAAP